MRTLEAEQQSYLDTEHEVILKMPLNPRTELARLVGEFNIFRQSQEAESLYKLTKIQVPSKLSMSDKNTPVSRLSNRIANKALSILNSQCIFIE